MKKALFILIVIAAFAAVVMPASAIIQIWQMPGESFPDNTGRTSVQFWPGSNTQGNFVVIERYQPNGNFWGMQFWGPELPGGNLPSAFSRTFNANGPFTYQAFITPDPCPFSDDYWYPPEGPVEYQLEDGMTTYIWINPAPDPYWYMDQCMGDYDMMTIGPEGWWP